MTTGTAIVLLLALCVVVAIIALKYSDRWL